MNTSHALHIIGFRSLILLALMAGAAACGASPEGPSSVDEQSPGEPSGEASDPDAAVPLRREAPAAPVPSLPPDYVGVPQDNGPGSSWGGGYAPPTKGAGVHTRS